MSVFLCIDLFSSFCLMRLFICFDVLFFCLPYDIISLYVYMCFAFRCSQFQFVLSYLFYKAFTEMGVLKLLGTGLFPERML